MTVTTGADGLLTGTSYWVMKDWDGNVTLVAKMDEDAGDISYWDRVYKKWIVDNNMIRYLATGEFDDQVDKATADAIIATLSDTEG